MWNDGFWIASSKERVAFWIKWSSRGCSVFARVERTRKTLYCSCRNLAVYAYVDMESGRGVFHMSNLSHERSVCSVSNGCTLACSPVRSSVGTSARTAVCEFVRPRKQTVEHTLTSRSAVRWPLSSNKNIGLLFDQKTQSNVLVLGPCVTNICPFEFGFCCRTLISLCYLIVNYGRAL